MLTETQKYAYKQDGFLVLKDVLSKAKIQEVLEKAHMVFGSQINRLLDRKFFQESQIFELFKAYPEVVKNCGKVLQNTLSVYELCVDPIIIKIIKDLGIKEPAIATKPVVLFNSPLVAEEGYISQTPQHQDFASIRQSVNSVVVWTPLVDIDKYIGPLHVVPSSHLEGSIAEEFTGVFGSSTKYKDKDFIPLFLNRGDIVIFNQLLVHKSGENVSSNRLRWSLSFRYSDLSEQDWIDRDYEYHYTYRPDLDGIIKNKDLSYPPPGRVIKCL